MTPATLLVDTIYDSSTDTSAFYLREAIALVNSGGNPNALGYPTMPANWASQISGTFGVNDTIEFAPNLYGGSTSYIGGAFQITSDVRILGPGANHLTITSFEQQAGLFTIGNVNVSISGLTLEKGTTTQGGAIYNSGTLTLADDVLKGNTATQGGAIYCDPSINPQVTLNVSNCVFTGNTASNSGGAIYQPAGNLSVITSSFSGNSASSLGGGIFNGSAAVAYIDEGTFTGNTSADGGGIANTGSLHVSNSTFSGDSASGDGGAIHAGSGSYIYILTSTFSLNLAQNGGAVFNADNNDASVIGLSALYDNTALSGGGAIYNTSAGFTLVSSTITGNTAVSGAGIVNTSNAYLTLDFATITGNTASSYGGGESEGSSCNTYSRDSILSGNIAPSNPDFVAGVNGGLRNSFSIVGAVADLNLSSLGNYGGVTPSIMLLPGSAAIGYADATTTFLGYEDQRGVPIPQGTANAGADQGVLLTVNTTADSNDGNVNGPTISLRDAITAANTAQSVDAIAFAPNLDGQTITLGGTELPQITANVVIAGPGATLLAVSGNNASRVFDVASTATVTISGLSIVAGNLGSSAPGGGIENAGTLTLTNSTISGCTADNGGGLYNSYGGLVTLNGVSVIDNDDPFLIQPGQGGGVDNVGTMIIQNSLVADNNSDGQGAGIGNGGTLTIISSTITANTVTATTNTLSGEGGGIFNHAMLTLQSDTISANSAVLVGTVGGIAGGIYNGGTVSLQNTVLAGNNAPADPDLFSSSYSVITDNGYNLLGTQISGSELGDVSSDNPKLSTLGYYGGPTETFALLAGSPALNAGKADPTSTDNRGFAFTGDIGAFQVQPTTVVNTSNDTSTGSEPLGTLSLRDAINLTNLLAGGTITFDISPSDPGFNGSNYVIKAAAVLPEITSNVTIDGTSQPGFEQQHDVYLDGTLAGPGASGFILSGSNDVVQYVEVASFSEAGIQVLATASNDTLTGEIIDYDQNGGFNNAGSAIILQDSFFGGDTANNGGGIYNSGALTVDNVTIDGESAFSGGGVFNTATGNLILTDSTITGNSAAHGGAIYNSAAGRVTVNGTTLSSNTATGDGGAIYNQGYVNIYGNSVISSNTAVARGGSSWNAGTMILTDSTVSGNTAMSGGGIFNTGALTLTRTQLLGNYASVVAGGIENIGSFATLRLLDSTVANNSASVTDGIGGTGGGIINTAGAYASIDNSTIANNAAPNSGGIFTGGGSTLTLTDSTVSGNQIGGGIGFAGVFDVRNSIIAGNSPGDLGEEGSVPLFNDLGYNLIGTFSAGLSFATTDQIGVAPDLGPLADNGGPTQTMAPQAGSPALGAGDPGQVGTVDQRGVHRGPSVDIGAVQTASFVVNTSEDTTGLATNSLRDAILSANGVVGPVTITFDPTVFSTATTILLDGTELPQITGDVTIAGPGASLLSISGEFVSRVFDIASTAIAAITGLTIADGNVAMGSGGGILNAGTLSITNCTITANTANNYGGGIADSGLLTLTDSTVRGNTGQNGGGIIGGTSGTLDVIASTISGNSGGGIFSYGSLNLTNSTVANNNGVGIQCDSGTATLTQSTVSGNNGGENGGGISSHATLNIVESTISGNFGRSYGGGIQNYGSLTISNSTISDNSCDYSGGAILNNNILTITDSTLSGNSAPDGGAIHNRGTTTIVDTTISGNTGSFGAGILTSGTLTVTDSTISDNSASGAGGGIEANGIGSMTIIVHSTLSGNTSGTNGGAIASYGYTNDGKTDFGTVTITNSTLSGNTADNQGGAINNTTYGSLTITNSTIANNYAFSDGGGIATSGTLTITSSTIADNTVYNSEDGTGGGVDIQAGNLSLQNSIIAANTSSTPFGPDIYNANSANTFNDLGYNLIGNTSYAGLNFNSTDIIGTSDLDLAPLANYGGPTETLALEAGSSAIGVGDPSLSGTTDQRGDTRGALVDIGAFQTQSGTVYLNSNVAVADYAQVNTPLTLIYVGSSQPVTVIGGSDDNTFVKSADDPGTVTFVGGGSGSLNDFEVAPSGGVTTLTDGGGYNTVDVTGATLTISSSKPDETPTIVGATINFAENDGQVQYVYDQALSNVEELGNLFAANTLLTDQTDGISLNGYFSKVLAGSDDNLTAAPSTYSSSTGAPLTGTTFVLDGANNVLNLVQGSGVQSFGNNNVVNQSFDATKATSFLLANQQTFYATNSTPQSTLFSNPSLQTVLFSSPSVQSALFANTNLQQTLFNLPSVQSVLFSNSTVQSALFADPLVQEALFNNSTTQGALFANPVIDETLFGNTTNQGDLFKLSAVQSALFSNAAVQTALFANSTVQSALFANPSLQPALFGNAAAQTQLFNLPSVQAALFADPNVQQALFNIPAVQQAMFSLPSVQTALFNDPTAETALFDNPSTQEVLFSNATVQQALFANTDVQQALFANPAVQTALFANPAVQQVLFANSAVQQALFANTTVDQALFANSTVQQALFDNPTFQQDLYNDLPTLQAEIPDFQTLFDNASAEQATLFADPSALQGLFSNSTFQQTLFSNAAVQSALFSLQSVQNLLFTNSTIQSTLFNNTSVQQALFAIPGIQTTLFASPSVQESLYSSSTVQQALFNIPTVQTALFALPSVQSALFNNSSVQTTLFSNSDVQQALFNIPTAAAALFGNATVQQGLFNNTTVQNALFANTSVETALFANPAVEQDLFANSAIQTALFNMPGMLTNLFAIPSVGSALFGNASVQQALFNNATVQQAFFGNVTVLQALFSRPTPQSELFSNSTFQAALYDNPTVQAALAADPSLTDQQLFALPTVQATLFGNTTVQQALFSLPAVQTALFNIPAVQQILFNNTTVQTALFAIPAVQNLLFNNPTVVSALFGDSSLKSVFFSTPGLLQALFTNATVQSTLFNDPVVQQVLFSNSTVLQSLFSDSAVQQALFNNPTVQSVLFNSPTVLTALFADTDVQQVMFGNGTTQQGLFNDPTVQAALFNNPTVQQVLFSIPSVQSTLFNNPTVQEALFANPTVVTALFSMPSFGTTLFNDTSVQQALFNNTAVQQVLFNIPAVQEALFTDPTIKQTLFAIPTVLETLFADPNVVAQLFADPTITEALFGDTAVQAALFSNPAVQQALFQNSTVLQALFAIPSVQTELFNDPTVQQALFGNASVQAAIFAIPSVQQTLFNNPTVQELVFGNSTVQQSLLSDPTVQAAIFGDPTLQSAIFSSTTAQSAILGSSAVQQAIFANPDVLESILSSDPTILQQVLTASPSLAQSIDNVSALSTLAVTVNLSGTGNEVTAGLLTTVNLGSGGLFIEETSPDQVNFVNQAVSNGAPIADYYVKVTAEGGDNTLVGGLLSDFTVNNTGTSISSNNFVLEDPSLLGLSGTTLPSAFADATSTVNGSGGSDTVYFVGTNLGNVAINEPSEITNDLSLDFSNFQSSSPISLDLTRTVTQTVSAGLNLTLPGEPDILHVVGSPAGTTLITNDASSVFEADDTAPVYPTSVAAPPTGVEVQYVWLNFDNTPTTIAGETVHDYTGAEEQAIRAGLEKIYAAFSSDIQFTLIQPNTPGGPVAPDGYVTIDYNSTPSSSGNLYVVNASTDTINEYDTNDNLIASTALPYTILPTGLTLDADGNLYVVDANSGTVSEYSSSLDLINSSYLTGLEDPVGLAFDSSGNLYVADAGSGTVSEYSPTGELINGAFISGLTNPMGLAVDLVGNLYVASGGDGEPGSGTVSEYSATGALLDATFLTGLTDPTGLTFDASDNIYVANAATGTVTEYSFAGGVLDATLVSGLSDPAGLAFAAVPQPGGQSDEIDFRNLNVSTFVKVDVNDFLGDGPNQVPYTDADFQSLFQNLSITISAHELGHTLGLRHEDAFGPIGFGISNPPGQNSYTPEYDGQVGAFTTTEDIIASPASVGSNLADAASGDASLGARDDIKLAFISDGTVVEGTNTSGDDGPYTIAAAADQPVSITLDPSSSPVNLVDGDVEAQPVSLYPLNVTNTIKTGFDAGKTFSVDAVDILGHIGGGGTVVTDPATGISYTQSVPNFYTFSGVAGELMTFEAMSAAVTRIADPIDTVLYIYGPAGNLLATNDDQFEPSDSTILDFTLPTSGTYTVEVDVFHTTDPSFDVPSSPNYRPVAYYDAQQGDYELFMYSFAAYNKDTGPNVQETPPQQGPVVSLVTTSMTATYGQDITLTATVSQPSGGQVSAGEAGVVNFYDGSTLLGSVGLTNGQASLTISSLSAGMHDITADYDSSVSSAVTETIDKATLDVTANATDTYGGVSLNFSISITGFVNGDTSSVVSGSAETTTTATTTSGVGSYVITVNQSTLSAANYTFDVVNGTLTIDPADLTVTAKATTTTYGASLPSLQYSYTGLVNGDSGAAFTGALATTATSASSVGGYAITEGTLAATGNYTIGVFNGGLLTVDPALLTVTAMSASMTYGGTVPALKYCYTGLVDGDTSANFIGALTTTVTSASNVGTYAISVGTLAAMGNYTIGTFNPGILTVNPALLTVTARSTSMTYGGTVPALTYTYAGLVNGNTLASFLGGLTTTATSASNVGGYAITVGTLAATGNYTIGTFNSGILTVNPAPLIVSAANKTMTYGGTVPALTYMYTGLVNGNTSASFTGTIATIATSMSNVGNYAISEGTLAATGNYTIGTFNAGTLTVNPAALIVTAASKTMTYGSAVPSLTYTYSGLVNGNTSASFTGSLATTATSASNVGTYAVTEGTLAATGNYTIGAFNAATLMVNPASLTVTATSTSMTYGATVPALSYTYTGLVNGNTSATFSGALATTATSASNVGNYVISEGTLAATGNYTIGTFNAGTLTVHAAALVVTAANKSMAYGGSMPALTYTYTGLVNGNTSATFSGALATTATSASNVGSYTIAEGTLAATGNYTIGTFNAGTLTVNPAALTVTATNATMTYGGTVPALNYTYTGLVNGNTSALFTGAPSTTATSTSNVGSYSISQGTLAATGNYTIGTFNAATLTVNPAALVVTAASKTMTYGGTVPALTYTYTGLVNGNTTATFTGAITTTVTSASNVGGYTIAEGTLAATGNYTIGTFNAGTLTVAPAALVVTAANKSMTYGGAVPALTYSYTGLVNGNTSATFTGALATTATSASSVGGYAITVGSLAATGNYTIGTFNAGTLTVNPAALVVTATNIAIAYGASVPTLPYTYSGLVNGNTSATFTGALTTTAKSSSNVGSYPITQGTLSATGNYTIGTFNAGTLTVNQASTTTTVTSSVNPATVGQSVTFTAVVSSATTTPTGSVTFLDGSATLGSGTLQLVSGVETASFTTSTLAMGTQSITARYAGNTNVAGSTSTPLSEVINASAVSTTTSVTASSATVNYGQSVSLTANVSANSCLSKPAGTVTFVDTTTSTTLGSATISNGTATLTTSALAIGAQTITATYGGATGFGSSSGTVVVTVTVTSSTLTAAYILDPSAAGALSVSGNAKLEVSGLIVVDSNSSTAISASGNAIVSGSSVQVVGKVSATGNAHISPTPVTGAAAVSDPLAGIAAPSTTGMTSYGAVNLTGNSCQTINPGIYSEIIVSGNGCLTLNSGIYIIQGGGFNVSGNGRVTGCGVMIDNTGSANGTFSAINMSGNGNISLSPITTGTYAGILFYQPGANTQAVALSGNGIVIPGGLIYAPKAQLIVSGNGQFQGSIIVDTLNISGNTILNALTTSNATVCTPVQIPTASGTNCLLVDATVQIIALVNASSNASICQSVDEFDTQLALTSLSPNLYSEDDAAASFLALLNQAGQNASLRSTDPAGAGVGKWEMQESLDVEWVHAIAPGAHIVLVEANSQSLCDRMASMLTAANQPNESVLAMNCGLAETSVSKPSVSALEPLATTVAGLTQVGTTPELVTGLTVSISATSYGPVWNTDRAVIDKVWFSAGALDSGDEDYFVDPESAMLDSDSDVTNISGADSANTADKDLVLATVMADWSTNDGYETRIADLLAGDRSAGRIGG